MGLGPELIVAQNDRDFSSDTVGNWELLAGGTGTLTFSPAAIGGDDDKQLLLTSGVGDTFLYTLLASPTYVELAAHSKYKIQADFYVPAGNVLKKVTFASSGISLTWTVSNQPVLLGDTWTTVGSQFYLGADFSGDIIVGFSGAPTTGDLLYLDNLSVRQVTSSGLTGQSLGMGL